MSRELPPPLRNQARLRLEVLEDRATPATLDGASLSNSGATPEAVGAVIVSFNHTSEPLSEFTFSYDFDNNGTFEITGTADAVQAVPAAFLADGPRTLTVRGRITNSDGESRDFFTTFDVTNVVPFYSPAAPQTAVRGVSKVFNLGTFSDPGAEGSWTVTVFWGDFAQETFTVNAPGTLSRAHAYPRSGPFTVTVIVADGEGTSQGNFQVDASEPAGSPNNPPPGNNGGGTSDPNQVPQGSGFVLAGIHPIGPGLAPQIVPIFRHLATLQGAFKPALGDVNGDRLSDLVLAGGWGRDPIVIVIDGASGRLSGAFFAYSRSVQGGVSVAVGDMDGDGVGEIITGIAADGPPLVRVFDGRTGGEKISFFAYSPNYLGGVTLAAGDATGDGINEALVIGGDGADPKVLAFDIRGRAVARF
jgi:hypothetical protein